ncbi:MAG TPA: GyrI-like domain-containing protein [Negativicutes bacterium]|nr:GyrI-like domain-containing protein [Negativicutes bacterium]
MDYSIEMKEKAAQPVLSIRETTSMDKLPQEIGRTYGSIMQYLTELGEQPAEAPYTAYYNLDMEHLDVEMGFPVSRALSGKGEIKASELPAGRYVECLYKGPYDGMVPVYEAMKKWIAEKGLEATGTAYEVYYNSPGEAPVSELLTRIMLPIR